MDKIPYENVSTIVKRFIKKIHREKIEEFCGKNAGVAITEVHKAYSYPNCVVSKRAYADYGLFYDYLIRKHIYNLKGENAMDHRAEYTMSAMKLDDEEESDDEGLDDEERAGIKIFHSSYHINTDDLETLKKSYAAYENKENEVLSILPDILKVSSLHIIFFAGNPILEYCDDLINTENIEDVLRYVSSWENIKDSIVNPTCGGEYFKGDGDLIINDTIVDFKVSKFDKRNMRLADFFQLIFYSIGCYLNDGKEIKKFLIYNPLLGLQYVLNLPNLNFSKVTSFLEEYCTRHPSATSATPTLQQSNDDNECANEGNDSRGDDDAVHHKKQKVN